MKIELGVLFFGGLNLVPFFGGLVVMSFVEKLRLDSKSLHAVWPRHLWIPEFASRNHVQKTRAFLDLWCIWMYMDICTYTYTWHNTMYINIFIYVYTHTVCIYTYTVHTYVYTIIWCIYTCMYVYIQCNICCWGKHCPSAFQRKHPSEAWGVVRAKHWNLRWVEVEEEIFAVKLNHTWLLDMNGWGRLFVHDFG